MPIGFVQNLSVYCAGDLTVVRGASQGDAMSFADELSLDDLYELRPTGARSELIVQQGQDGTLAIAKGSAIGKAGNAVHLDAALTMMTVRGTTTELLLLVEVDSAGHAEAVYVLALAPLEPRLEYALIGIDRENARSRFAEVACVSFLRGTHVTLASGAQALIEDLKVGDMVLTRDDGPRPLRWIGNATTRAVGGGAPIRIRAGALNNSGDLIVSPESRLLIYQRSDALGVGRSEVLVCARHLVNGDSIVQQDGGFVDYFQLLFDEHQIIYAGGIAIETMLVNPRTRGMLPAKLNDTLPCPLPGHSDRRMQEFEVQQRILQRPDLAELLRRASIG